MTVPIHESIEGIVGQRANLSTPFGDTHSSVLALTRTIVAVVSIANVLPVEGGAKTGRRNGSVV